jgi:two-component system cell cycle response regulator
MADGNDDISDSEKTSVVASDTLKKRIEEATRTPPSIVLLAGPAAHIGKQWALTTSDLIIGRAASSHIFVDDRSVSKSHARLVNSAGQVSIIDLESTNKTLINDQEIAPLVPRNLKNNDQIKVGSVIFKFLEQGSLEALSHQATFDRSQIDALTGAYNKGALLVAGPESFKRARGSRQPMCVLAFDIDHFKKINDTHGHPAGDYVLRELGSVVGKRLIRSGDYFSRYGGEEFVVILNNSQAAQAIEVGERIRQTLEGHKFVFEGTTIPVTVSVGATALTPDTASWEDLFKRADEALYASKKGGRNRVTMK